MTKLDTLIAQRGRIKGNLTRLQTFLNKYLVNSTSLTEINLRLNKSKELLDHFNQTAMK